VATDVFIYTVRVLHVDTSIVGATIAETFIDKK
jgi:hypothetical protein